METQKNSIQMQILSELKELRKDIEELKKKGIDNDYLLTREEAVQYKKSKLEYERGETISLDDLKKELKDEN